MAKETRCRECHNPMYAREERYSRYGTTRDGYVAASAHAMTAYPAVGFTFAAP
jgi:hypothetical protein